MTTPLQLGGGLDLFSPTLKTNPGTLAACLNYEVSGRDGYTRISGLERYDGGPSAAAFRTVTFIAGQIDGSIETRDPVTYKGTTGYVVAVEALGDQVGITVAMPSGSYDLDRGDILQGADGSAVATGVRVEFEPRGKQEDLQHAMRLLASARRAQVEPVPGREESDVLGIFMLRSKVYAVRDLPRVNYSGGYYGPENEGRHIQVGTTRHKILDLAVTGYRAGYIVYDPVPAAADAPLATPIGTPILTNLPVSGTLASGLRTIAYDSGFSVSGGLPPYRWEVADVAPPIDPPAEIGDLSEQRFLAEQTHAALWEAQPAGGWTRIAPGREIAFTDGGMQLRNYSRALNIDGSAVADTGLVMPTVAEVNGAAAGNLLLDDDSSTDAGSASGGTVTVSGFTFDVPGDAQLLGITVEVKRQCATAERARDLVVTLTGIPGQPENKAGGFVPTTAAVASYGGAGDLWGCENLTVEDVNTGAMGVIVSFAHDETKTAAGVAVLLVKVRLHYAIRGGMPLYLWNGSSDVRVVANHIQLRYGDPTISTGEGYIHCTAAPNAGKPRLVAAGEEIRTEPMGAGSVIGKTASTDRPIFLPGQLEVDNNRSAYSFRLANFFAQEKYAAVYGVSGAGPAFAFDGTNIIKIRSPLSPDKDLPRHIFKHGMSLGLGFFGGAILLSMPGDPMNMRGEDGAVAIESGDRLSAAVELPGDALGIVCTGSSSLLRGMSAASYMRSTLSAARGAIEYTSADMGRAILADSFGLFYTDAAESFGAAARDYISSAIEPLLRERLQATLNDEQRFLRPICALAVRAKSQYRLFFHDGWIVTGTYRTGGGVQFTTQRYFTKASDPTQVDVGWPVRTVASGMDASGRERLFCAFAGAGARSGYVFEMDVGNSLDGEPLHFHMELNPLTVSDTPRLTKVAGLWIYGAGTGYANLEMHRADSFLPAIGTSGEPVTLGRPDRKASLSDGEIKGYVDFPLEGYEFSLAFSGSTDIEAPHTLQLLQVKLDNRGDSRGNRGD